MLEASICIGSGIDVILDFVGIAASTRYGPEINRCSCRLSKSQLSHHVACVMASDKEVGPGRFRSKSLTSSRSPHQNALISALSSQSTSQASCQNSVAYTEATRNHCWSDRTLVIAVRAQFISPKVLVNSARNASRSVNSREFFSNNGENQEKAAPASKLPINPIWISAVGYLWMADFIKLAVFRYIGKHSKTLAFS